MTANHRPLEDGDIELIERVRSTPCLYDTRDANFRLVYKKEQEWQSIAEGLAVTDFEARKRWTVLRDRYARELKQLILHPDSTEYGKNDFFLRMDFIRNFVKKREVKRKRCRSQGIGIENKKIPKVLKLYKVKSDTSAFESDDNQCDSQYSTAEKFSYVEQMSQEPIVKEDHHVIVNSVDNQCEEQDYRDYVEDTTATYEAVDQDNENIEQVDSENYMLPSPENNSRNTTIKPESPKMDNNFCFTTVEDRIPTLPQLQQRPIITNNCPEAKPTNLPVDIEEYFSKTISLYLRQLSPRHKIKAKVEIMQIIEKYIDLEEGKSQVQ